MVSTRSQTTTASSVKSKKSKSSKSGSKKAAAVASTDDVASSTTSKSSSHSGIAASRVKALPAEVIDLIVAHDLTDYELKYVKRRKLNLKLVSRVFRQAVFRFVFRDVTVTSRTTLQHLHEKVMSEDNSQPRLLVRKLAFELRSGVATFAETDTMVAEVITRCINAQEITYKHSKIDSKQQRRRAGYRSVQSTEVMPAILGRSGLAVVTVEDCAVDSARLASVLAANPELRTFDCSNLRLNKQDEWWQVTLPCSWTGSGAIPTAQAVCSSIGAAISEFTIAAPVEGAQLFDVLSRYCRGLVSLQFGYVGFGFGAGGFGAFQTALRRLLNANSDIDDLRFANFDAHVAGVLAVALESTAKTIRLGSSTVKPTVLCAVLERYRDAEQHGQRRVISMKVPSKSRPAGMMSYYSGSTMVWSHQDQAELKTLAAQANIVLSLVAEPTRSRYW